VLVEPDDKAALADALAKVATDEELRGRLVSAGLERASRFSWDRAAAATDAIIADVLAEDG
jgi:glycosyltransferase involved in cell wall biosynthesis